MGVNDRLVRASTSVRGIVTITMVDRETGIALGEEMVRALRSAFERAPQDPGVRVVVLAAEGPTFSSGAPRDLRVRLARGEVSPADIWLPKVLLDCPVPVIAAAAGHATGGGLGLALAADIVLLGSDSRYGFTFMNLGFTPGMGMTRLAEHVLSAGVAHELLYTGELRKGAAFAGNTGVNHVRPASEVPGLALDLAARIAEKPRPALEVLKRTLSLPRRRAFEESLTLESMMHQLTLADAAAAQPTEP
jgi:polyketide biosynthesis enoyl-CoA hydratase PksI